jgi:cell division transport system permease protein
MIERAHKKNEQQREHLRFLEITESSRSISKEVGRKQPMHLREKIVEVWSELDCCSTMSQTERASSLFKKSVINILRTPGNSLLTFSVVVAAMLVVGGALLLGSVVDKAIIKERQALTLTLFLRDEAESVEIEGMLSDLRSINQVKSALFYSKESSLETFRESLGTNNAVILGGLEGDNPLPASIEVTLYDSDNSLPMYERLRKSYDQHPAVETVQYNRTLLRKLSRLLFSLRILSVVAVCLVIIVAGAIIANVINLALYTHRNEIVTSELLGAAPRQIVLPYLFEGVIQGFCGSCVSLTVLWLIWQVTGSLLKQMLAGAVAENSVYLNEFLSFEHWVVVLSVGTALGFLGSYFGVSRFRAV